MALPTPCKDGALESCAFALEPPKSPQQLTEELTMGLLSGQSWAPPMGSSTPKISWEDALRGRGVVSKDPAVLR